MTPTTKTPTAPKRITRATLPRFIAACGYNPEDFEIAGSGGDLRCSTKGWNPDGSFNMERADRLAVQLHDIAYLLASGYTRGGNHQLSYYPNGTWTAAHDLAFHNID